MKTHVSRSKVKSTHGIFRRSKDEAGQQEGSQGAQQVSAQAEEKLQQSEPGEKGKEQLVRRRRLSLRSPEEPGGGSAPGTTRHQ